MPNWSPDEMKVIEGHLGDLRQGQVDALVAAKACLPELRRVWKSQSLRPRLLNAVHQRVLSRAKALGIVFPKQRLRAEEARLVEPYARGGIRGIRDSHLLESGETVTRHEALPAQRLGEGMKDEG